MNKKIKLRLCWTSLVLGAFLSANPALATYTFDTVLSGTAGSGEGRFGIILDETETYRGPPTIRVLEGRKVFVCDGFNKRVLRYDSAGNYELTFGDAVIFQDGTDQPDDVAELPSGEYMTLGVLRSILYRFSADGILKDSYPAQSSTPVKMIVDKEGRIYTLDIRNDWMVLLDASFSHVANIGGPGTAIGHVVGFGVTNGGHLVISNHDDRLHLKSYAVNAGGETSLVKEISLKTLSSGEAGAPYLLRIDDYGHVYMRFFDQATDEVVVRRYNASGNVLSEYKLPPRSWPIEVDAFGDIYFGQTTSEEFRVLKVVE